MDVGIERLTYRGVVGSLASSPEMVGKSNHGICVDRAKRHSGITVTKVVDPPSLPLVDLSYYRYGRHAAALRTSQIADRLSSLRHSLAAGGDVQVATSATVQVPIVAERVAKKVQ